MKSDNQFKDSKCPECLGAGVRLTGTYPEPIVSITCSDCNGTGKVTESKDCNSDCDRHATCRGNLDNPKELPHSRACGWKQHSHGTACHANCPTCGDVEYEKHLAEGSIMNEVILQDDWGYITTIEVEDGQNQN